MERETKTIKTTGGHEVVMKASLLGREARELRNALLAKANLQQGRGFEIKGLSPEALTVWENKSIELLVISVDGETEGLLDKILDLPAADYNEVFGELQKGQGTVTPDEKKG